VDLRFNKDFSVWKFNYSFLVTVTNLFDTRNVSAVYGATGRADPGQNYFNEVFNQNVVYAGSELDQNPLAYGPGRSIQMGISINF
jgi:hypothetical protein